MIRLVLLLASLAWPVTRTHQELIDLAGRKGDITHLYDLYNQRDWVTPQEYGAVATDAVDDTRACSLAVATGRDVFFPGGTYYLANRLNLLDSQQVVLTPSTVIRQTAASTNIFRATSKTHVWIHGNGATLWGEGTYRGHLHASPWTGNEGNEDRGVQFLGCTRSGVTYLNFRRFGSSGVTIEGGSDIKLVGLDIEGTHTHGTPLVAEDNFQNGLHLRNSDNGYGILKNIQVLFPRISGTAQGVLLEGYADQSENVTFLAPLIRSIPGQHGFYLTNGGINIVGARIDSMAFAGIKAQSADSTRPVRGIVAENFHITRTGSQAVEMNVGGTGSIVDVKLSGVMRDVQRGLTLNRRIRRVVADIVVDSVTQHAVLLQDTGLHDIDIRVKARHIGQDGILVTAVSSDAIRIFPTVENAGMTADSTYMGILVSSPSAKVDIFNPVVVDSFANTVNGIYNSNSGSTVGVHGYAYVTGAEFFGVRSANALTAWPLFSTVSSAGSAFHDVSMIPRTILRGTGTPEGAEAAPVGTLFLRTNGGAATTLYVKESGTGNTGWAAK